jgi:hypothetical protein
MAVAGLAKIVPVGTREKNKASRSSVDTNFTRDSMGASSHFPAIGRLAEKESSIVFDYALPHSISFL